MIIFVRYGTVHSIGNRCNPRCLCTWFSVYGSTQDGEEIHCPVVPRSDPSFNDPWRSNGGWYGRTLGLERFLLSRVAVGYLKPDWRVLRSWNVLLKFILIFVCFRFLFFFSFLFYNAPSCLIFIRGNGLIDFVNVHTLRSVSCPCPNHSTGFSFPRSLSGRTYPRTGSTHWRLPNKLERHLLRYFTLIIVMKRVSWPQLHFTQ